MPCSNRSCSCTCLTSAELNTSGSRKFSRAHSSWRLFCRGVPVRSKRLVVLNSRTISESYEKAKSNFKGIVQVLDSYVVQMTEKKKH